jgi:hypothetical protein
MTTPRTFCTFSREFSSLRRSKLQSGSEPDPDTVLRVYSCDLNHAFHHSLDRPPQLLQSASQCWTFAIYSLADELIGMPTSKHRVSINLAENEYSQLANLSRQGRVSMAWLAREALIDYLASRSGKQPSISERISSVADSGRQ